MFGLKKRKTLLKCPSCDFTTENYQVLVGHFCKCMGVKK